MPQRLAFRTAALSVLGLAIAAPLVAQPMPGWGPAPDLRRTHGGPSTAEARIGKVEVSRFRADDAAGQLGHGTAQVVAAPVAADGWEPDPRRLATYEAAVVDRLAAAGYDVASRDPAGGQVVEIRVSDDEVVPAEAPHKPVSGEMSVGVSNRGSMMGLGLQVDLSKPRKALVSTRLEARVRDRASGAVLWEGRASIITRDGDPHWGEQDIAARLALALFDGFPGRTGEETLRR